MMLEHLAITFGKLEYLPQGLHTFTSLQDLRIYQCSCLISFPKTGLPSSLRRLGIECCDALRSLSELMILNNLEKLVVRHCPLLMYLSRSRSGLLPTLKELTIKYCGKLESLLEEEGMNIHCPSLEKIRIYNCKSLNSLPNVTPNNNLRNLRTLMIKYCDKLESLPEGWFTAANLSKLTIFDCKKLQDLPQHAYINNNHPLASLETLIVDSSWPAATGIISYILKEGSSFTNLTSLSLYNVDLGKPPSEWGLHRLSSQSGQLCLEGYSWASTPEDEMLSLSLPTSLTSLSIREFPNLEKLSCKGFQNLTSLEQLDIDDCPMLTSASEVGLLPSLSRLYISHCPKLASFVVEQVGLPPSLLQLWIKGCPILKQRCEKGKGQYWPFIARIPHISIEG